LGYAAFLPPSPSFFSCHSVLHSLFSRPNFAQYPIPLDKLRPKKHLGQHFLHDERVVNRIADALEVPKTQPIIEIGPGEGVLTRALLDRFEQVSVVEVDPDSVAYLTRNFPDTLTIFHQDVLTWKPGDHLEGPTPFMGNLPYNISSPFFFLLLENLEYVDQGVFMIQKEVADRICAGPGSKTFGILSVLLGHYFEREYLFSVSPGAFRPPPKVMSGVIRLRKKEHVEPLNFSAFKRVVKAAFGMRRKTLRNALKSVDIDREQIPEEWWSLRAEQMPIENFVRLTKALK